MLSAFAPVLTTTRSTPIALAAGLARSRKSAQIGVPQSMNAIFEPAGSFFLSGSVTGKALGLPVYGAIPSAACFLAAASPPDPPDPPLDAVLLLELLLS